MSDDVADTHFSEGHTVSVTFEGENGKVVATEVENYEGGEMEDPAEEQKEDPQ